jgi:hypothetical protein
MATFVLPSALIVAKGKHTKKVSASMWNLKGFFRSRIVIPSGHHSGPKIAVLAHCHEARRFRRGTSADSAAIVTPPIGPGTETTCTATDRKSSREKPMMTAASEFSPQRIRRIALGDTLHRSARRFGERTAVIDGDRHLSYRELDEASNRFAHYLLGLGMRSEDRVACCAPTQMK